MWFMVSWQILLELSLFYSLILSVFMLPPPPSLSLSLSVVLSLWTSLPPSLFWGICTWRRLQTLPRVAKPNGFPHLTLLDQTSLLTSVAAGYYFTELTNFRWGAVIKWSGMETCPCLLMPQVFRSPKYQPKATGRGKNLQVWLLCSNWRSFLWTTTVHDCIRVIK